VSDHDHRSNRPVLYIVACAAPPAMDVGVLIDLAHQDGWDVCLIATPRAFQWLDVPGLAGRTGHPVRHDYKLPGEPDLLPDPDAIIVAPATFNTINKWAAGIADTLALGLLCEATGKGLPVVVLPYLNAAQGEHPALGESIERLRRLGSGSYSAPMCCRCIDHARASATSSPGTSPSPPSWRLPSTSCGDYRASPSSSATCS
jgi:phosphopantothenoylcysteine decarboxylase